MDIIMDVWKSISNKGIPANEISYYYKVFPITFGYPEENLLTTYISYANFTDLEIDFLEYGSYKLIFVIDGI